MSTLKSKQGLMAFKIDLEKAFFMLRVVALFEILFKALFMLTTYP